jgi:tripartite-type tricarboxylate transporter receptor subunit TctC
MPKWLVVLAAVLAAVITFAPLKFRQPNEWPSHPVTMIVPFAAGGPTDVVGRIVAERLSDVLGQQVVVENVGGAGGRAGTRRIRG